MQPVVLLHAGHTNYSGTLMKFATTFCSLKASLRWAVMLAIGFGSVPFIGYSLLLTVVGLGTFALAVLIVAELVLAQLFDDTMLTLPLLDPAHR
jgi:hypothetical protein